MKQRWILGIFVTLIAVFLFSCTGFFDQDEEIIPFSENSQGPSTTPTTKTIVYFDNIGNNCSVDVFANYLRENKIVTVESKRQSADIDWVQAENGFDFYFVYNIPVSGTTFPYTHKNGFTTEVIPKDKTTRVTVQPLSNIVSANEALFTDSLITIKNNNASAIQLLRGNSVITTVNNLNLISNGQTSVYKITPGAKVSDYSILLQNNKIAFPSAITAFEGGYLYEITLYNANNVQSQSKQLTRGDLKL